MASSMQIHHVGDWNILCKPEDLDFFQKIQGRDYHFISSLKEHHRSQVMHINIDGQDLVLKIPVEKNNRKWIRFITLFRKGEAFRNIDGMLLYQKLGIPTTRPLMAAEKRRTGMVIHSWVLYEFLDADPCLDQPTLYPGVIDSLKTIHDKGYLHGDPQIRNFLFKKDTGQIYVIDSNPKPVGSGFSRAYEFAYLRKSAPGIENYFGNIKDWWLYRLAFKYDVYERKIASIRKKIKKIIGLSR